MSTFRQQVQGKTDWGKPDPVEEAQLRRESTGKRGRARPESRPASRAGARTSITAHRLFPALAALWFAALFGLGSLAISGQALGVLVTAIGLPTLVPAAAPPLGFTAHLLVALVLTMLGGGFGLLLGLRLRPSSADDAVFSAGTASASSEAAPLATMHEEAGVPKVRARDAHPDAPPRRPLVLTEAFADPQEPAITEQLVSDESLLRRKPGQAVADDSAIEPGPSIPVYTPGGVAAAEPLALAALDPEPLDLTPLDLAETGDMLAPLPVAARVEAPHLAPEPEASEAMPPEPVAEFITEPASRPVLIAATPQGPEGFTFPVPDLGDVLAGLPRSPVAGAPLEGLGLVQLVERLALAIAARKAASDASPLPPSEEATSAWDDPAAESNFETALPIGAMPAAPAASGETPGSNEPVGSAREAIMRRLGVVAAPASADTAPAPFSRPAQALPKAPGAADGVVPLSQAQRFGLAEQSAQTTPVPRPSSVSGGPFAAPAARSAAPAVATAPDQTDEALRSALATLQRMTARA